MTRVICTPGLTNFQREVDQFLNGLFRQPARPMPSPPIATGEDESGYYLEAALPGLDPASVQVRLQDRTLSLSGKRAESKMPEGSRCCLRERSNAEFSHRLQIPRDVDSNGITADYTNGILSLSLPKAESAKPRQIEVQVS